MNTSTVSLLAGLVVFVVSHFSLGYYIGGDVKTYREAFEAMRGLGFGDNLRDIWNIYQYRISGDELVHVLLVLSAGALEVSHAFSMALLNGIFAAYAVRLLCEWGAKCWIAVLIVLTNYYFYVLYIPAERLKVAFLFAVFALFPRISKLRQFACIVLSLLSHFSVGFIFVGIWFGKFFDRLKNREFLGLLPFCCPLLLLVFGLFFESEYLIWKMRTYVHISEDNLVKKLLPIFVLFLLTCMYVNKFSTAFFVFCPCLLALD
jgi:hypothetical protein